MHKITKAAGVVSLAMFGCSSGAIAEFTSDVPLARVLLARDVMEDAATATSGMHEVQSTACVEDLLSDLATHREGVAVVDRTGTIGIVTPTSVVCALSRGGPDVSDKRPAKDAD